MKHCSITIFGLILILLLASCGDLLVGPDPENTPERNFEILWHEFDRYYPFFELKQIDWQALYNTYRPDVSATTDETELLQIISNMLNLLKDVHVNIFTDFGTYLYSGWWNRATLYVNFSYTLETYIQDNYQVSESGSMYYGRLADDYGYIYIPSFSAYKYDEKDFKSIDKILEAFETCPAVIIDVRSNGGGNSSYADLIASRFAEEPTLVSFWRYRNGPQHQDFTDYIPHVIKPEGKFQFLKPVVVLINRRCFSSTENFVLSMRSFPHVTIIGDTTGGGFGNPIFRELPNGWTYRLPRSMQLSADSLNFEGVGIPPDIPVQNTLTDSLRGVDTTLERAMQFLEQSL
jgi:hypothetical protein